MLGRMLGFEFVFSVFVRISPDRFNKIINNAQNILTTSLNLHLNINNFEEIKKYFN